MVLVALRDDLQDDVDVHVGAFGRQPAPGRTAQHQTEEVVALLAVDSFRDGGQQVPALGRQVRREEEVHDPHHRTGAVYPVPVERTVLDRTTWQARAAAHAARVDAFIEPHLARRGSVRQAPGARLPLHLLLPASGPAAALASGVRRRAGRRAGVRRAEGLRRRRRHRASTSHRRRSSSRPAPSPARDRGPAGAHRLLRAARVGDGLPPVPRRAPAQRLAAAARVGRHRRGRRVAPGQVLALRRVPLLHPAGRAAQHAPAGARRPVGLRATGLPPCRDGPLQARLPADADDQQRPGRRLLRAGARHPRARHARCAVRPRRSRLRADPDRDAGREGDLRAGAAGVRRAGRAPAAAADRGVRATGVGAGLTGLHSIHRANRQNV